MAAPEQWKARQVSVKIGDKLAVAVGTTTDLFDQLTGTLYEDVMQDAELTLPERDTETTKLLGTDATSNAQNQIQEDAEDTDTEFTATTLAKIKDFDKFFVDALATGGGDDSDMTFYNYGADRPANGVAIAVRFASGTNIQDFLLDDVKMTQAENVTVDAEGAAEGEITFKATSGNTYSANNYA